MPAGRDVSKYECLAIRCPIAKLLLLMSFTYQTRAEGRDCSTAERNSLISAMGSHPFELDIDTVGIWVLFKTFRNEC